MIGEMIRRFRTEKDLSQAELSEMVNIVQTHISRIERGLAMPSVELLIQLVQTLEIPSAELLGALGLSAETRLPPHGSGEIEKSLIQLLESMPDLNDEQRKRVQACLDDQMEIARLRRAVSESGKSAE